MKINVSRINQINGKLRVDNKNFKITLVVENMGGLGVKTTKKQGKLRAKFESKFMFQKFYQIQGKVQGNNIDYEN